MKTGAKIFGALSGVLILYLLLGVVLPGTWRAEVEADVPGSPPQIFRFIERPDQWVRWNPLPASGVEFLGPESGPGAGLEWNDPQYGRGRFVILSVDPPNTMEYEVSIEDGRLMIRGRIDLSESGGRTRLQWREDGDFGWNPLMGYAARGMADAQSEAMRASLETLEGLIE